MKRRLLISYVALTAVIVLLLELPTGELYARRERDALASVARRDAAVLAAVAEDSLENPGEHDLGALAAQYQARTGAEVAVSDNTGRTIVSLDSSDPRRGDGPEFHDAVAAALRGRTTVSHDVDDGGPETVVTVPVRSPTGILGAVAVAVPAAPTDSRILRAWLALGAFAVVLLGVAALLGLWLARGLSRPLLALAATSSRLGEGDLSARAPVVGPAEIAALSMQFNRTASRLSEAMAAQEAFVADASHQLRTPLTALRLRLENLAAELSGEAAGHLEDAQSEVDRLSRLVDGLLALSRAQQQRTAATAVDVAGVVNDRCAAWAALADEQDVELTVDVVAGEPVRASVMAGNLEQILDNLLANALEASPPGRRIEVGVANGNGTVTIHLRDHGPGLSEGERQRAFDRFWQGGATPTGNSGLGLAIVRQLAAANGGTIILEAPTGGGLDAVLRLPAAGEGEPSTA